MFDDVTLSRFWSKVVKGSETDCWPWIGGKGRGRFYLNGRSVLASHVVLVLAGRDRPDDKQMACHTCDNPNCVNPSHLWWGTNIENVADMINRRRHRNNRKTHCLRGHEFSGDNLLARENGQRGCRICQRARNAAYKRRKTLVSASTNREAE